jgi:uncharacterized protein with HEPN domain
MRHILVHGYFELDLDIIWYAVQINLAQLKEQIIAVLEQMGETD